MSYDDGEDCGYVSFLVVAIVCLSIVTALAWSKMDYPANEFEELDRIHFEQSKWITTECIVESCDGLEFNLNLFKLYGVNQKENSNGSYTNYIVKSNLKCKTLFPYQRPCYWSEKYNRYNFEILSTSKTIFLISLGSISLAIAVALSILAIYVRVSEYRMMLDQRTIPPAHVQNAIIQQYQNNNDPNLNIQNINLDPYKDTGLELQTLENYDDNFTPKDAPKATCV